MRREHQEAGVLGAGQKHHRVVGGRGPGRAGGAQLAREPEHGLVAVVAVGDQDLLVGEEAGEARDRRLVVERPHPVANPIGRRRVDRGRPGRRGVDHRARGRVRVPVEAEDGRDLGARRPQQAPPVFLRSRERVLVGEHHPAVERLQPHRREEPAAGVALAGPAELLLVDVAGVARLGAEDPLRRPGREQPGRAAIARVVFSARELEPDHVVGIARLQRPPLTVADDVVGRGEHVRQVGRAGGVVAESAKRSDLSHTDAYGLSRTRRIFRP